MNVESSRTTTMPSGKKDVHWSRLRVSHHTRSFTSGSECCRLGNTEQGITDSIMTPYPIRIAPTVDLMVPELVCSATAFRAGIGGAVERDTQPIPEATAKFLVLEVEGGGWYTVQPVTRVGQRS